MRTPLLLLLTGCLSFTEQREAPEAVFWSGWVIADLATQTEPVALAGGGVDITGPDGASVADTSAEQPYDDSPGYWQLQLPPATQIALRLTGPDVLPWVWRTQSPGGNGLWLTGALFARDAETVDGFLASVDTLPGVSAAPIEGSDRSLVWGEPLDPSDWIGATIVVIDGEGVEAAVLPLTTDDSGALVTAGPDDPIDLFLGLDLAPGTVEMTVTAADGGTTRTVWPAQGGDVLSAVFYHLDPS